MAIYGIGAYYDVDVSNSFISNNMAGVGWNQKDAPELHEYIKSLKVGDIVYIKAAFGGGDITIKGVGIIKDNVIQDLTSSGGILEVGRNVKWISKRKFTIPKPQEKNNVRNNTIYEEFHPDVQAAILGEF